VRGKTPVQVLRAQRANACVGGTRAFSPSFQSHNTSPDGGARAQRRRPSWSLPSADSSSPKSLTACLLFLNFMPRGQRCSWTM
jgi:predicted nucleic acid-binding Zn ribbon protein